jgi:hypothetical protein
MAQLARRYQESLRDEEIINDLYSDNLSDVPDDIFSESDNVSGSDKEGLNVLSECESGFEGSDSDDTAWVKVDKTPTLGQFTRYPGLRQIPSHPTEVPETVDLFFGDSFFDMLCQETNRYYLQNHEKYDSNYKVLKWVDVTSAEMKKLFAVIFLMGHTRRDTLKKEYWSTDPFFKIPIFGKLMSRKRFEQIWWCRCGTSATA